MDQKVVSLAPRVYAYLLDMCLVIGPVFFLSPLILNRLGLPEFYLSAIYGLAIFATLFLYEPLLVARCGGTLGHHMMSIRVLSRKGENLSFLAAFFRFSMKFLLGFVSFLPLVIKNQTIHDLAAGSHVVKKIR